MKVKETQNRDKLSEGRSHQMGFALCKLVGKDLETVQPISPCKDYLNDVVWSEHTGKQISAYGLTYKPQGLKARYWYLAFKICPSKYGGSYKIDEDKANLKKNHLNIQTVLNEIEEKLGFKSFSKITEVNDDIYVLKVPSTWCSYTYAISLYSLLVRMSQFYSGKESVEEFLENYKNNLDTGLWTPYKKKFKKFLETGFKEQDLSKLKGGCDVHNHGFCTTPLWSL